MDETTLAHPEHAPRSMREILEDVVDNLQGIIRSEIQLAKTEFAREAVKAKAAGAMLAVGIAAAAFGAAALLLCVGLALSLVIPAWASALIIGFLLMIAAAVFVSIGRTLLGKLELPKKTMFTVKEDVQWMRKQSKS